MPIVVYSLFFFISFLPINTLYSLPFSSIRVTFPNPFILHDFITVIIFGEEYKS